MNNKNYPGKLAFYISEGSPYQEAVAEIENAFTVDRTFPGERDLTEELIDLLEKLQESPRQKSWLQALREIKEEGEKRGWRKLAQGDYSAGNKLSGNIDNYRVAAFILQPAVEAQYENLVLALKLLYLSVLIKDPINHRLSATANNLRLKVVWLSLSIDRLSKFSSGSVHSYLREFIKETDSSNKFIKELHGLIENLLRKSTGKESLLTPSPAPPAEPAPIKIPLPNIVHIIKRPGVRPFSGGDLLVGGFRNLDDPEASSPDLVDFISLKGDEGSSEIELQQKLKESKYWLARHSKVIPSDWGRFTPLEHAKIVEYLHTHLKSESVKSRNVAGLIGLIFITGMTLEELYSCSLGDDQVFSKDCIYRKEIRKPDDAWEPTEEQKPYLETIATILELPLPEPICQWLSKLGLSSKKSFKDVLKMDFLSAEKQVEMALNEIREGGLYKRVRMSRLLSALSLETTLIFQNPVITYQLAATMNQGAPSLSYYAALDADELSVCYEKVTSEMMKL